MTQDARRIGWIGLGNMGLPMAANLVAAGHRVTGFDTDAERIDAAKSRGIAPATSLEEAARASGVLFTMIPNDTAFLGIVRGVRELLSKDASLIDMSTLSPHASAEAARLLDQSGAPYLRAPVSGSTGLAEQGTLTIMVSGPADAFEAHRPLLERLGRTFAYLGTGEEARVAKLVINTMIGAINTALAEAMNLGRRNGLDWEATIDLIAGSAAASPYVASKVDKLKRRDWSVAASVALVAKDMDMALELARQSGTFMPLAAITRQMLAAKEGRGEHNLDMASLVTAYE